MTNHKRSLGSGVAGPLIASLSALVLLAGIGWFVLRDTGGRQVTSQESPVTSVTSASDDAPLSTPVTPIRPTTPSSTPRRTTPTPTPDAVEDEEPDADTDPIEYGAEPGRHADPEAVAEAEPHRHPGHRSRPTLPVGREPPRRRCLP